MIAAVPVEPGREQAAELARDELAKQIYHDAGPGLTERFLRFVLGKIGGLVDDVAGVSPGGYSGLAVVLLLVVVAVIAVRLKLGPLRRTEASDPSLFTGRARTAAEHRAAADRHAATGEWAEAVRERLRAVVRSLEERAVLDERPGRTADEAAAEGGQALPSCAAALNAAARLFDDIWYGARGATREHDASMRAVDDQVMATKPEPARSR